MKDYFKYDILYVMNITDIDDKIIRRARTNHLLQEYISKNHSMADTLEHVRESLKVSYFSLWWSIDVRLVSRCFGKRQRMKQTQTRRT